MSPYVAEFFGTLLLIVLGDGVVANVLLKGTKGENAGYMTIVIGWGLAVALAVYAIHSISGAHINPAVTLALFARGDLEGIMVAGYIAAQVAGAFAGAVLVWLFYFSHWERTENAALKLAVFCTAPAVRNPLVNLFCELFATAILVLGVLFIVQNPLADGFFPLLVGALVASIGFSLGGTTGFAINPARDLGPRIAHFLLPVPGKGHSDWSYAWIPVVGPLLGGLLGAWVFETLF